MRIVLRKSFDEGSTWSEPVCCMTEAGYYVVNNDRVIQPIAENLSFLQRFTPAPVELGVRRRWFTVFTPTMAARLGRRARP